MAYAARVVADSCHGHPKAARLTTIEVTFPRIVLAEFNTHRMFSRNSASSRAIPIAKRIAMVESDPYVPREFGSNQKGMQSGAALVGAAAETSERAWRNAARDAVDHARTLEAAGVHKEYANRLLEPFCWHTVIVTATEWQNFWNLRCHPNASPPIRRAAEMMWDVFDRSTPSLVSAGGQHLPYVGAGEIAALADRGFDPAKVSIGRCARVSYLTHDGVRDFQADLALYDRLLTAGHMSPFEHVARPATKDDEKLAMVRFSDLMVHALPFGKVDVTARETDLWFGNFRGWVQYRKEIPGEAIFTAAAS